MLFSTMSVDLNLSHIIDKINTLLCESAKKKVSQMCYGYGCGLTPENVEELIEDKKTLESELRNSRKNIKGCYSEEELGQLLAGIEKKLITCKSEKSLKIDDTKYSEWLFKNPICRVYESWEACENTINPVIDLSFNVSSDNFNYNVELEKTLINLKLDSYSKPVLSEFLLNVSSKKILEYFELNSKLTFENKIVNLNLNKVQIYYDLITFFKDSVQEYHLEISQEISKNIIELQVLFENFNVHKDLEIFLLEKEMSLELGLVIEKINCFQNLELLVELFENDILDFEMFKQLYNSGCLIGFNPISIQTKRDIYDLRTIRCNE